VMAIIRLQGIEQSPLPALVVVVLLPSIND
jgi:hypothetical protein